MTAELKLQGDHDVALFALVALVEPFVVRGQMLELAKQANLRDARGKSYTADTLELRLQHWQHLGLIFVELEELHCDPEAAHSVLTSPAARKLQPFLQAIDEEWHRSGRLTLAELNAVLRSAMYRGDHALLAEHMAALRNMGQPIWRDLLGCDCTPGRLALVPDSLVRWAWHECVNDALLDLDPIPAAWTSAAQRLPRDARPELVPWLAMARLLQGNLADTNLLLASHPGSAASFVAVAVAALGGRPQEAQEQALRAVATAQADRRNRPTMALYGPGAPWAALTLLRGNSEERQEGKALLKKCLKQHDQLPFFNTLSTLAQHNKVSIGRRRATDARRLDLALATVFDRCFVTRETREHAVWQMRPQEYADSATMAQRDGYTLLADQLMAATMSGFKSPLAELGQTEPPWERALGELEAVVTTLKKNREPQIASNATRICWELMAAPDGFDLRARRQKRRGNHWTKGQPIAAARLHEIAQSADWLEQDREIVRHLEKRIPNRWSYGPPEYVWNNEALLALVGHPSVQDWDTGEPLEIVRGQPELRVSAQGDELEVGVEPSLEMAGIISFQHGNRLEVVEVTPAVAKVARALRDRPRIPREQQQRLLDITSHLTRELRVTSDVALSGAGAKQVPADSRIHVLCWRASPGMRVRMVVKPLGAAGPTLPPGVGSQVVADQVGGELRQTQRDFSVENDNLETIGRSCPALYQGRGQGLDVHVEQLEDCYQLLLELSKLGDSIVLAWPQGDPLSLVGERGLSDMRLTLSSGEDWLAASVDMELDEGRVAKTRELLNLFAGARGRFIELGEDRVLALTEEVQKKLERLQRLGNLKRNALEVPTLAAAALDGCVWDLDAVQGREHLDAQMDRITEAQTLKPRVPRTLRASLRDYQVEGFRWMCRLAHWGAGALLCDDMGLGKTMQILALLLRQGKEGPCLVVAPTSVCDHWRDQIERFAPRLSPQLFGAGDRAAIVNDLADHDVLICSYGLLQREAELLCGRNFAVAVLDEAQAIKNRMSLRAKAAHALDANTRVIATGTPVENHLGELWSLFEFANPGLLGGPKQFDKRFAGPIADGDSETMATLRQLTRPFILRRTKGEVLEQLPEKTEITLKVSLSDAEATLYEAVRQEAVQAIQGAPPPQRRMLILTMLTRLRQAACHPDLVSPDSKVSSSKHELLFELLDELREGDHRALVFSQFVQHLSLVRAELDARGISYLYLDGSSPAKLRPELVRRFQEGEGDLFLISLRAGGTGLNLTAADYVIHLDPWWNPAVEAQASDRAHRIGQQRPVTVYRLIAEHTVEERILKLHADKREVADQLLEGAQTPSVADLETLRALIEES